MTLKQAIDTIAQKDRHIKTLSLANESAQRQIDQMKHQLEQYIRRIYGRSSEKYEPGQLFINSLILETEGQKKAEELFFKQSGNDTNKPGNKQSNGRPHGRMPIPEHLERVEILIDVPEEKKKDKETGEDLVVIGYETSEKIEYRRGSLYVNVYKRPKYGSADKKRAEDNGIVTAELPEHPIAKCKADIGLLSHIIVSKFCDHLPLNRQENIFARENIIIPRSTQDGWLMQLYEAIRPLGEILKKTVLDTDVLFTDDSVIPLQEEGRNVIRQARLWVYSRGDPGPPLSIYDFTVDRRKKRPIEFLNGYQGYIHADAYSGYDELFRKDGITEVGCWAHARRYFDKALLSSPVEADEILRLIKDLYEVESEGRELPPGQRYTLRRKKCPEILDKIFKRLEEMRVNHIPSEPLSTAIDYALKQKKALKQYLEDGRLKPDNNTAENAIRPLAVGRKNWLFTGSERGGHACALYISLIQSCKACQVNPWEYFNDVLRRIMSHPVTRLSELLPDQWQPLPKDRFGHIIPHN